MKKEAEQLKRSYLEQNKNGLLPKSLELMKCKTRKKFLTTKQIVSFGYPRKVIKGMGNRVIQD